MVPLAGLQGCPKPVLKEGLQSYRCPSVDWAAKVFLDELVGSTMNAVVASASLLLVFNAHRTTDLNIVCAHNCCAHVFGLLGGRILAG